MFDSKEMSGFGVEILYADGSKHRWEGIPWLLACQVYNEAFEKSKVSNHFTKLSLLLEGKDF